MLKFNINFKKRVIETVDNAEGTPGASRQYTRFNSVVKPKLEEILNSCKWLKDDDNATCRAILFSSILLEHNFAVVKAEDVDEVDVLVTLESTEK